MSFFTKTDFYVTSYCNKAHRICDGKPIEHECHVLPSKALRLEWFGNVDAAIEIIRKKKPLRVMRRGVRNRG